MTDSLSLGGLTLTRSQGGVDVRASTSPTSIRLQAADLPEIVTFLIEGSNNDATRAALDDTVEVLNNLTDAAFLLVHQVMKGFRTDAEVIMTRFALEDAIALLRDHGKAPEGCDKCGSRNPESSPWHANNCLKEAP